MYGSTHGYAPNRRGFFLFPADKQSNNERVFVIQASTVFQSGHGGEKQAASAEVDQLVFSCII